MALPLSGKVALITGASKGVGRGIALELARHGATIVVNYNSDQAGALATLEAVNALGAPGMIVQANVGDTAQITAETINDQPATAEGPMDPDKMSDQDVMAMAMEADKADKADY